MVDGVTGDWSAVAGCVNIYVLQKSDPLGPVDMSPTILAKEPHSIFFYDVDTNSSDGDCIAGAIVQDLSTNGVLY